MIGFSFKGRHSSTLNIGVRSLDRTLRPAKKQGDVSIVGRHGTPFTKEELYENRQIRMVLALINNDDWVDLRGNARDVSEWLSGEGRLIFDDEPDKYYYGTIYEAIGIEQIQLLPVGGTEVTFECQPFAYMVKSTDEWSNLTWENANIPWVIQIPWDSSNLHTFKTTGIKTFTFINPGTQKIDYRSPEGSRSQIKIVGSWSKLVLSMNDETLSYEASGSGTIIVDNVDMDVRLGNTSNIKYLDGSLDTFLPIKPGINTLTISGTALNVDVTIDYIPQWI